MSRAPLKMTTLLEKPFRTVHAICSAGVNTVAQSIRIGGLSSRSIQERTDYCLSNSACQARSVSSPASYFSLACSANLLVYTHPPDGGRYSCDSYSQSSGPRVSFCRRSTCRPRIASSKTPSASSPAHSRFATGDSPRCRSTPPVSARAALPSARPPASFPTVSCSTCPPPTRPPAPAPSTSAFPAVRNSCAFYLAVPQERPGGINVALQRGSVSTRFYSELQMLRDENSSGVEKPVSLARKNLQILAEGENLEGSVLLPLARIERTEAGGYRHDPSTSRLCSISKPTNCSPASSAA